MKRKRTAKQLASDQAARERFIEQANEERDRVDNSEICTDDGIAYDPDDSESEMHMRIVADMGDREDRILSRKRR
jgi:hypothetical protein